MIDNEFFEFDRITKIQSVMRQYGEDNFFISYSGGLDSNVLSVLVDLALPNNNIPRVYCDTGIELNAVRDFVKQKAEHDERVIIIQPKIPIKQMLNEVGYPFKSKVHSERVHRFQKYGLKHRDIRVYLGIDLTKNGKTHFSPCPKILKYQFTPEFKLKISQECYNELKKSR